MLHTGRALVPSPQNPVKRQKKFKGSLVARGVVRSRGLANPLPETLTPQAGKWREKWRAQNAAFGWSEPRPECVRTRDLRCARRMDGMPPASVNVKRSHDASLDPPSPLTSQRRKAAQSIPSKARRMRQTGGFNRDVILDLDVMFGAHSSPGSSSDLSSCDGDAYSVLPAAVPVTPRRAVLKSPPST